MHQILGCLGWVDIFEVKGLHNVGTLSVPRGSRGWGYAPDFLLSNEVRVDGLNLCWLG